MSIEDRFTAWAQASLSPLSTLKPGAPWQELASLGRMIGDASVVALSEGVHCIAEPLEFRNRLFEYLAREKGFTAIAIESGITESRLVHDYVREGSGDLDAVIARGISWTFDCLPQNRALIEWMRAYNADPRHPRKLNFYGFDVPGSPGNPKANRGVETALVETLAFLERVDSAAAAAFHARLDPLEKNLRFDRHRAAEAPGYDRFSQAERDALTTAIADFISLIERKEAHYTAASADLDYRWAYRTALGARQVDNWLRQLPLGWQPSSDEKAPISRELAGFLSASIDVRDRAQADNIDWIREQEGPSGKVLVFAARYHLSAAPVKVSWVPGEEEREQHVAGTYLRRRLGQKLLAICNAIGPGEAGCGDYRKTLEQGPPESIDGLAGKVGSPLYVLDLRTAAEPVTRWLEEERRLAHPETFKMSLGGAFDVLLYTDAVTAACPNREKTSGPHKYCGPLK